MNWKKVKLESDLCYYCKGKTPPSNQHTTTVLFGLPFFQGKADFGITSNRKNLV
jgi:hypothetical protein